MNLVDSRNWKRKSIKTRFNFNVHHHFYFAAGDGAQSCLMLGCDWTGEESFSSVDKLVNGSPLALGESNTSPKLTIVASVPFVPFWSFFTFISSFNLWDSHN